MNSKAAIKTLLTFVLGLPLLQAVLMWVGGLLGTMGDAAAGDVLEHIRTAAGVLWLVSLVGLVVALALQTLDDSSPPSE